MSKLSEAIRKAARVLPTRNLTTTPSTDRTSGDTPAKPVPPLTPSPYYNGGKAK